MKSGHQVGARGGECRHDAEDKRNGDCDREREGEFGGVGFGIYAATKEGIRGLSRTAAREWGKHGIRVNVICPAALSPAAKTFLETHPKEAEYYLSQVALGYFGDSLEDIGPVAVFLASAASKYVTGQTILVDGGAYKGL